ncbi:MAG TPA: hypothetical protein VFI47_24210 [Acidimicrobiales bacterium]|nr:hypothetical protein [Acidimicrobiales bacterium]
MTAPRTPRTPRPARDDRGNGALDLSVMGVCFFVPVVLLLVFAGRVNAGHAAVESAARHAARTISIARDPAAAEGVAEADAATTVHEGSAMCRTMDFVASVEAGEVTVTVSCDVDLSELALLPVPGTREASATAVEVIDKHRESVAP